MIKVSVVVPIYNVEKYLSRCIDSLVQQTLKEIEIILVNDGTKDSSDQIAIHYSQRYNNIIYLSKENGGLSDARNFGIAYCKGEYIGFLDSDDYAEKDMYLKLYEKAKESDADIVTCDYYKSYTNYNVVVKSRKFKNNKDMLIAPKAAAWNKIYRASMLKDCNVRFPKGLLYEDTAFWAELVPHCKKDAYVNMPLLYYVQRKGSIINTSSQKTLQIFDIFNEILTYYKNNNILNDYYSELEYFCTRIAFGSNLERIASIPSSKMRKELSQITCKKIKQLFPQYSQNIYLRCDIYRRLFYLMLNATTISIFVEVLRLYLLRKNYGLYGQLR